VAVGITPKFSDTKKLRPIMLDAKTVLKPITTKMKHRRVESSQPVMTKFSQYICYGEEDSVVVDL
jgi:hypothetical protein